MEVFDGKCGQVICRMELDQRVRGSTEEILGGNSGWLKKFRGRGHDEESWSMTGGLKSETGLKGIRRQ